MTDLHESHKRILLSLHLAKHLTAKQLARLMYPEEYNQEPNLQKNKAYQRVIKNLQTLEKKGLLKSDSYGVMSKDVEKFWRIFTSATPEFPKRIQDQIIKDYGFEVTNWKVHSNMYFHEKDCSEIFVSLVLTERLNKWLGEGDQKQGFRHDRKFQFNWKWYYLEVERGSQKKPDWQGKIISYQKLYRETKESFHVLFAMRDEESVNEMITIFEQMKCTNHYVATTISELVADPLTARLTSRNDTIFLA